jgi:ABC-type Fe3+-hydroxamate transport system substrate-binding protein
MGLENEIVGITRYCVYPKDKVGGKPRIGGTKLFDYGQINLLKPDLIIGSKEENYPEGIHWLKERYPVWMSDVNTLEDALEMIRNMGRMLNRYNVAEQMAGLISTAMEKLSFTPQIKTAYLIWKNPYMVAGGVTFIDAMMEKCGLYNVFKKRPRYPIITPEELNKAELILLSSEPYCFNRKEVESMKLACPGKKIEQVDGTCFSWYGSRLLRAADYFRDFRCKIAK